MVCIRRNGFKIVMMMGALDQWRLTMAAMALRVAVDGG